MLKCSLFFTTDTFPYLRDASTGLVCFLLIAPVTSRQRVFQTVGNDSRLNCQLEIEVFAAVNELLSVHSYLLCQVPEQPKFVTKTTLDK